MYPVEVRALTRSLTRSFTRKGKAARQEQREQTRMAKERMDRRASLALVASSNEDQRAQIERINAKFAEESMSKRPSCLGALGSVVGSALAESFQRRNSQSEGPPAAERPWDRPARRASFDPRDPLAA